MDGRGWTPHGRGRDNSARARGRGFQGGRGDPRAAYGPPPSAHGRRPWSSGPGSHRSGFDDGRGMPPPLIPPPGRGRGRGYGGMGPPQKRGAWGVSRGGSNESSEGFSGYGPPQGAAVLGSSRDASIERSQSVGRSNTETKIPCQGPSERGDTLSTASSTENLTEPARQKKSHPIVRSGADLASVMSKLQVRGSVRIPDRPDGGGQSGTKVEVMVNCWDFSVHPKSVLMYFVETTAVYRLDKAKGEKVEIRMPPKEKRNLIQQIVDALPSDVIYDGGHAIYSEKPIPNVTKEGVQKQMEIKDPLNRDQLLLEYRILEVQTVSTEDVKIFTTNKHATSLDMPQDSIRLLDCLLKTICKGSFVALGRTALYYDSPEKIIHDKLFSIHKGFITSVRPQWKVRVNIDMSCKAFFTCGNLADVMYNKYGDRMASCSRQMAIDLRKIRVETLPFYKSEKGEPYSRRFTIHGISSESAGTLVISDINQTVEKYFAQHHGITLKYPELPCAKVSLNRDVFLPMELLKILPYQTPNAKKSEIASEVIRCAAVKVHDRFRELQTFVSRMMKSPHPLVSKFGLKVNSQPMRTPARVLNTPVACFGGRQETLQRGSWNPPSFYLPAGGTQVIQWVIVSVPGDRFAQKHQMMLAQEMPKVAMRFNLRLGKPEMFTATRASLNELFQNFQRRGVNLVLLVLYDELHYPSIKRLGDIQTGMRTQCVRGRTLEKPRVIQNLLLKINGKLGGVNWQIKDIMRDDELIMVFGADVTHPAPTQTQHVRQSIAAVLGSVTPDLMRYAVVVRQQATTEKGSKTTREIIDAMQSIVLELLKTFARNNQDRLPTRLIFYRDGVSEGQFENVLVEELASIQSACSALRGGYEPAITYIVVQKRHHVRFQPLNPGRKNVDPGTVVDTEITHPREFDFYLCSQEGIQGTSKPAHYHVLYDDSNWSSDALQNFTYFLCHAYMRCPRSVSYPAPTYYAHLAAFRARDWISDLNEPGSLLQEGQFRVHNSQVTGMYYL